jgi:hypothetical protein
MSACRISLTIATSPAHLILIGLNTGIIFGYSTNHCTSQYVTFSSLLSPSSLGPNIFLSLKHLQFVFFL